MTGCYIYFHQSLACLPPGWRVWGFSDLERKLHKERLFASFQLPLDIELTCLRSSLISIFSYFRLLCILNFCSRYSKLFSILQMCHTGFHLSAFAPGTPLLCISSHIPNVENNNQHFNMMFCYQLYYFYDSIVFTLCWSDKNSIEEKRVRLILPEQ